MTCIQFLPHGWLLWHQLSPSHWWSDGVLHPWPPSWAWHRFRCPAWIGGGVQVTLG